MEGIVVRPDEKDEFPTPERCSILESWNDSRDGAVSIARARVIPGVTTQLHSLDVAERYLITEGRGEVSVGKDGPAEVGPGDVVIIPPRMPQQIANTGDSDLIFYCICSPRFSPEGYESLE